MVPGAVTLYTKQRTYVVPHISVHRYISVNRAGSRPLNRFDRCWQCSSYFSVSRAGLSVALLALTMQYISVSRAGLPTASIGAKCRVLPTFSVQCMTPIPSPLPTTGCGQGFHVCLKVVIVNRFITGIKFTALPAFPVQCMTPDHYFRMHTLRRFS